MTRNIPKLNPRTPPRANQDDVVDAKEERKWQRHTAEDLYRHVSELDGTTPDMRDKVTFKSNGELRQVISHKLGYVPEVYGWRVVFDGDDEITLHEYKEADRTRIFIKTNAPKDAKVTLRLHSRD